MRTRRPFGASLFRERLASCATEASRAMAAAAPKTAMPYDGEPMADESDHGRTLVMSLASMTGPPVVISITYVDPRMEPSAASAAAAR